jgi:hypothetical protein
MNIFEMKKSDIRNLPEIATSDCFQKNFDTVIFNKRSKGEDGYSAMDVILAKDGEITGKLMSFTDSISFEERVGVTWHMDCLPCGAMQVWATSVGKLMKIWVSGSQTIYLEAK